MYVCVCVCISKGGNEMNGNEMKGNQSSTLIGLSAYLFVYLIFNLFIY